MTILIIEEDSKEQEKAKKAALNAGLAPAVAATFLDAYRIGKGFQGRIEGIVTDISLDDLKDYQDTEKISPLSSTLGFAVKHHFPVSVCTNKMLDHNNQIKDLLGILSNFAGYRIPVTQDKKDWGQAIANLKTVIENQKTEAWLNKLNKILFVVDVNQQWVEALEAEYKQHGKEVTVITATYEDALLTFNDEKPDVVVIAEFSKFSDRSDSQEGQITYDQIRSVASNDQLIIKSGFIPYNSHSDDSPLAPVGPIRFYRMLTKLKALEEKGK